MKCCRQFWFPALLWTALALPFCYYVALTVVTGLESLWIPFGLSVATAVVSLLHVLASGLFVTLDSTVRRRAAAGRSHAQRKHRPHHFAGVPLSARPLHHKEAVSVTGNGSPALPHNVAASQPDRPAGLDVVSVERVDTSSERDDDSGEDEGKLSSISLTNDDLTSMHSSIHSSHSAWSSRHEESHEHANPFAPPRLATAPVTGIRLPDVHASAGTAHGSGTAPSTTLSTLSPSRGRGGAAGNAAKKGITNRNSVKENLGSNSNPRKAWQSFTSLLADGGENEAATAATKACANAKERNVALGTSDGSDSAETEGRVSPDKETIQLREAEVKRRETPQNTCEHSPDLFASELEGETASALPRFTYEVLPWILLAVTVLLTLLLWAGSFVIAYYTNILFAILPLFACPFLWYSLGPVQVLLHCRWAVVRRPTGQTDSVGLTNECATLFALRRRRRSVVCALVRVVTHGVAVLLAALISLLLYVAAIALPLARQDELLLEGRKHYRNCTQEPGTSCNAARRTPKSIIAVCYLSPIPMALMCCTAIATNLTARLVIKRFVVGNMQEFHALRNREPHGDRSFATFMKRGNEGDSGLVGKAASKRRALPSECGGERVHNGATSVTSAQTLMASQTHSEATEDLRQATMTTSADTASTLSSILRSSIFQNSHCFMEGTSASLAASMDPVNSSTPVLGQVTKPSQVHFSRQQSISASGSTSLHPYGSVMGTPQPKTVTMLYIAYRDIFGSSSSDDAKSDLFQTAPSTGKSRGGATTVGGASADGGGAARSRSQGISTKFEALLQAIEDARSTPANGDAAHCGGSKADKAKGGAKAGKDSIRKVTSIDETHRMDSDAYVLTAYEDAVVLVWGLLPFSSEPVKLAVEKAERIFANFRRAPKPVTYTSSSLAGGGVAGKPGGANGATAIHELTAAVVYAPHSLVGFIPSGSGIGANLPLRSVHFFNPDQHTIGSALLERGFQLHRKLHDSQFASARSRFGPKTGVRNLEVSMSMTSFSTQNFLKKDGTDYFKGILLDSRAVHSAASHILARPCGVINDAMVHRNKTSFFRPGCANGSLSASPALKTVREETGGFLPMTTLSSRTKASVSGPQSSGGVGGGGASSNGVSERRFAVIYDFVTFVKEKEEEWHLVVQRNEQLSYHFRFLVEAVQLLQQSNVDGATRVLRAGIDNDGKKRRNSEEESENIVIAKLVLEDIEFAKQYQR